MKYTLILFSLLAGVGASAQTTIHGKVTNTKKEALPGVNILLKDTYDGASSDTAGAWSFTTDETGKQILIATFVGYLPFSDTLDLHAQDIEVDIELKEAFNELNAVVISAGAFEASDEKKNTILKPLDIVTTAGADGDIYGALQTLPGATKVGNNEGLYVRGGSDYETSTIIDGLAVNNPYFSTVPDIPSRGRFSPFLFKGTVFSTGGYSAEYGQALSSAIILNTEDFPDATASGLSLSPIFIGGFHEQKWKNTAFGGGLNNTNLSLYDDLLKPRTFDWIQSVRSYDGNIFFRQKVGKQGLIKLYGQAEHSHFAARFPDVDSLPSTDDTYLQNSYSYVNSSYQQLLGKKWSLHAALGYSYNLDSVLVDGYDVSHQDKALQSKATLTDQITEKVRIRFGGEWQKLFDRQNLGSQPYPLHQQYSAEFAESDIFITDDLAGRIGVRTEYSDALGKWNVAPRISLAYKTGKNAQVSLAYGEFYETPQPQFLYSYSPYETLPGTYEEATHYILNYQFTSDKRTFRIEGYYKQYHHLVTSLFTPEGDPLGYDNKGYGYARGFDIFFRDKKTLRNVDYWISYSFLDTKRKFIDYPMEVTPTFAAQNVLSIVYKQYVAAIRTQIGATYQFISGWPYFNPNKSDAEFLSDVSPDLHNLSVNLSYLCSIFGNFTVIFASCGNVLGFKQIYGYTYSMDGSMRLAEEPPVNRTFFIGMFLSIQYGANHRVDPAEQGASDNN